MNLRIGKVSNIDADNRQLRVMFEEDGLVSGWLKVISARTKSNAKFLKEETVSASVESETVLPKIGETVLCAFEDGFNADGYVLGVII